MRTETPKVIIPGMAGLVLGPTFTTYAQQTRGEMRTQKTSLWDITARSQIGRHLDELLPVLFRDR